jgi:hypothetical protein
MLRRRGGWTRWGSGRTASPSEQAAAPRSLTRGGAPAGAGARRGAGGRGRQLVLGAEGARGRGPGGAPGAPARAGLAARRARRRRALRRHRRRCGAGREGSVCVVSGCEERLLAACSASAAHAGCCVLLCGHGVLGLTPALSLLCGACQAAPAWRACTMQHLRTPRVCAARTVGLYSGGLAGSGERSGRRAPAARQLARLRRDAGPRDVQPCAGRAGRPRGAQVLAPWGVLSGVCAVAQLLCHGPADLTGHTRSPKHLFRVPIGAFSQAVTVHPPGKRRPESELV